MNQDYLDTAWGKAFFAHVVKYIEANYLPGGGGPKDTIVSDDVPFAYRDLPPEFIAKMVVRLEHELKNLTNELNQYTFKREDVRPIANPEAERKTGGAESTPATPARGRRASKQGGKAGGSE